MLYSEFPAKRKTMLSNSTRGSTFGETPASLPREVRAQAKIRTMTKDNRKCRIVLTAIILQRGRASRSGSPLRVSKLTAAWYCDYREFRPHLNQHPRGTLIADLVDELATVPTIAPDLEDSGRLRRTVDEYIQVQGDRKSTRLNSSHRCISYAVFCLKKKKKKKEVLQEERGRRNRRPRA